MCVCVCVCVYVCVCVCVCVCLLCVCVCARVRTCMRACVHSSTCISLFTPASYVHVAANFEQRRLGRCEWQLIRSFLDFMHMFTLTHWTSLDACCTVGIRNYSSSPRLYSFVILCVCLCALCLSLSCHFVTLYNGMDGNVSKTPCHECTKILSFSQSPSLSLCQVKATPEWLYLTPLGIICVRVCVRACMCVHSSTCICLFTPAFCVHVAADFEQRRLGRCKW